MSAVVEEVVRPKLLRRAKAKIAKRRRHSGASEDAVRIKVLRRILGAGITLDSINDELCRRSLAEFTRRTFLSLVPSIKYQSNWHVDLICEYLEAVQAGEIRRLLINIPPRFLKSVICSIAFPAWLLGHDSRERLLCASYSAPLSLDLSVRCRRVMQSEWYARMFPDTRFSVDQNEKSKYETTNQGSRVSTSVGGTVTGFGGRYKILDDPIDPQGVFSKAELERCKEWLDQVWSSRQDAPKDTREVVIMQRLHPADPTAHLKEQGGWEVLTIPQEAEQKTVIQFPRSTRTVVRKKGDLLHPEYFGPQQAAEAKSRLGPYGYAAQQQQRPVAFGGGRIKVEWFPRYVSLPVQPEQVVASADTASKKGEANAKTCIGIFTRKDIQWHLAEVVLEKWGYPELKNGVIGLHGKYHADAWLIEDKSSGTGLLQDLRANTQLPVIAVEPIGDKVARMERGLPFIASGRIALPEQFSEGKAALWLFDVEQTLAAYPALMEADFIDMLSQFIDWAKADAVGGGQLNIAWA